MMGLLFHAYGNIIDRLNTSGYCQYARDLAEGLLIVGYNEGMEAEAFFAASRAYTGANNVIAGLLFYYTCLLEINRKGKEVSSRFAFDLYWQYLKICRIYGIYPKKDIVKVTELFEKTNPNPYDKLSYYHTLFTVRLMANELGMSHVVVSLLYMAIQLVISLGFVYLCPNTILAHWIYLIGAGLVMAGAYVLFMKKNYHLHEEYLASLQK